MKNLDHIISIILNGLRIGLIGVGNFVISQKNRWKNLQIEFVKSWMKGKIKMENLGLFSQTMIDEIVVGNEYIEFSEGCLLDNFIFWDSRTQQYFLCIEHALNEWSSCYEVFVEGGEGIEIFNRWNKLMDNKEAYRKKEEGILCVQ